MAEYKFEPRLTPEGYARETLRDLGVHKIPINAKEIVEKLGIRYREDSLDIRIDGCLYREGSKALMVINKNISYERRKNFTIAHEIGHFQIKGHDADTFCSSFDISASYGGSGKTKEREANCFASELLMPEDAIKSFIKDKCFNFSTIESVAEEFQVSLIASALRTLKLCNEKVAIVVSRHGKILWSFTATNFKYTVRIGRLNDQAYAYDAFYRGEELPKDFNSVNPRSWLSDTFIPQELNIQEHSHFFSDHGMVLTLLKLPFDENDYDEEDLFTY